MSAPANANEGCVGPASETAGKADGCAGCPNQAACASGEGKKPEAIGLGYAFFSTNSRIIFFF
jgi:hypothetical protein